jgi:tetrahydromethanopterin S-methyltransferase subunit B
MRYSKIEGNSNLLKDEVSGAVLNTNKTEYENYLLIKKQKEKENLKIHQLETEVNDIKNTLNEIHSLLRSIFNESR